MIKINKNVNHDYFSVINNERKAYFLGLIYADGTIVNASSSDLKNRQKQLCIALQEEDGYLLEEICKDIKPFKNITYQHPPNIKNKGWKKRAVFKISSNKICEDLINLGCLQRKSIVGMNFPIIDDSLINHFIRGFFDGDGCIYVKEVKNNYKRKKSYNLKNPFQKKLQKKINFCSTSKLFLEKLISKIDENVNFSSKIQWRSRLRSIINYSVTIEGKEDVEKTKQFLYLNSTIFMKRKLDRFSMAISSQAENTFSEGSETT